MSVSNESQPDPLEPSEAEQRQQRLTQRLSAPELWGRVQAYFSDTYGSGPPPGDTERIWRREVDELTQAIQAVTTDDQAATVATEIDAFKRELAELHASVIRRDALAEGKVSLDGTSWRAMSSLGDADIFGLLQDRFVPFAETHTLQTQAQVLYQAMIDTELRPASKQSVATKLQTFIDELRAYPRRDDPAYTTDEAAVQRGLVAYANSQGLFEAINQAVVHHYGRIDAQGATEDAADLEAMFDYIVGKTVPRRPVAEQFAVGTKLIDSLINDYINGSYRTKPPRKEAE